MITQYTPHVLAQLEIDCLIIELLFQYCFKIKFINLLKKRHLAGSNNNNNTILETNNFHTKCRNACVFHGPLLISVKFRIKIHALSKYYRRRRLLSKPATLQRSANVEPDKSPLTNNVSESKAAIRADWKDQFTHIAVNQCFSSVSVTQVEHPGTFGIWGTILWRVLNRKHFLKGNEINCSQIFFNYERTFYLIFADRSILLIQL